MDTPARNDVMKKTNRVTKKKMGGWCGGVDRTTVVSNSQEDRGQKMLDVVTSTSAHERRR